MNQKIIRIDREQEEGSSSNRDANMTAISNVKWDLKGTCHNKYPIHMLHTFNALHSAPYGSMYLLKKQLGSLLQAIENLVEFSSILLL